MKPIRFWSDTLDTLRQLPDPVRRDTGYALDRIQRGETPPHSKPVPSVGKGAHEIRVSHIGEAYRTFYVARFSEAVYVFYVVHKKARKGIALPKHQADLAARRYREIADWRASRMSR